MEVIEIDDVGVERSQAALARLNDAMKEYVLKNIPLARVGTAKEVASAALYLASDEAAYVTGQVLRVNGGMYV